MKLIYNTVLISTIVYYISVAESSAQKTGLAFLIKRDEHIYITGHYVIIKMNINKYITESERGRERKRG